ncbi:hypothetical protein CFI10_13505 [Marinobacterium iners]|uniref:hypothetical protein n=1 Tax=Marinobacterium iners TaxID=48076 RepID=UPI001A90CB11|nr:hypothetical protein [Marinobacterium iners]QSR35997.1 hypothetical protein CFI10_13505 [Marinobacterium iners]
MVGKNRAPHPKNLTEVLKRFDPEQGKLLTWPQIGAAIVQAEAMGYPDQHNGEKHWIETLVEPLGLKRASAWRYRANARGWPWLRAQLRLAAIKVPDFEALDPNVSAEKLELLMKLVKVAPIHVWKPAAEGVLDQSMPLAEIRRLWAHYRQMLQGKTARSRGSKGFADSVSVTGPADQRAHALYVSQACQWLDQHYVDLAEYVTGGRVVRRCFTQAFEGLAELSAIRPDAVAGLVFTRRHVPLTHAFVITPDPNKEADLLDRLKRLQPYADAVWLVTPEAVVLPDSIGIILFDGVRLNGFGAISREALHTYGPKGDVLALWLLSHASMLHVSAQDWPDRPKGIAMRLAEIFEGLEDEI